MTKPTTEITANLPPSDGITADGVKPAPPFNPNENPLPSIELYPSPGRWECIGLWSLVLAPTITLAVCFLFRTGRDLTLPFEIVQLLVFLVGVALAVFGWRRRDALYVGIACLSSALAFGISFIGLLEMMGCGDREYTIFITTKDAVTGMPVRNADVKLYCQWGREDACADKTNPNGESRIPYRFFTDIRQSPVCEVGYASFSEVTVKIEADGYAPMKAQLGSLLARAWSIHDPPPPPIEIRLIPKN